MTEAFDVDLGAELRDALRHEAYRLQVGLSAGALTARLQAHERDRRVWMPVFGLVAAVVGFALVVSVGALFSSPRPHVGGSATPGGSPCPESPPTRHGSWWVEIGGPNAFFNVDPGEAHHATTTSTRWLLIVRFDPDAASPDNLSVSATNLSTGARLAAVLNSRMEPGSIARVDEPAPPLPGGWYLFEQAIPTGGCWRLTAEVAGELAGSATVEVLPAQHGATANPDAPTPAIPRAGFIVIGTAGECPSMGGCGYYLELEGGGGHHRVKLSAVPPLDVEPDEPVKTYHIELDVALGPLAPGTYFVTLSSVAYSDVITGGEPARESPLSSCRTGFLVDQAMTGGIVVVGSFSASDCSATIRFVSLLPSSPHTN